MQQHVNDIQYFVVISDNMKYCRSLFDSAHFNTQAEFIFIRERDFIDLWISSLCNHNITSNSTFSWWGAYLNNHKDNIVVVPKKSIFLEKKNRIALEKGYYFDEWVTIDE